MWYGVIRVVFTFVIAVIISALIRKKVKKTRCLYFAILPFSLLFILVLYCIPFENLVIRFDSPQKAFLYGSTNKIYEVVEGENSALIISEGNEEIEISVIPRDEKGWKVGTGEYLSVFLLKKYGAISVDILKSNNTKECYIVVNNTNGDSMDLKDSINSEFYCVSRYDRFLGIEYHTYYAYIGTLNESYELNVNGEAILISE